MSVNVTRSHIGGDGDSLSVVAVEARYKEGLVSRETTLMNADWAAGTGRESHS